MHSTPSTQHSTVISLLQEGYSLHQVQSKTSLGKSTIGRIKKEMDWNKENNTGGCPSKLSSCNKQSIIRQITTGKLDDAVQAANFINNILPNPITPQTVRNVLKENNFCSVIKKKCPLLKKQH
jgi:transposase